MDMDLRVNPTGRITLAFDRFHQFLDFVGIVDHPHRDRIPRYSDGELRRITLADEILETIRERNLTMAETVRLSGLTEDEIQDIVGREIFYYRIDRLSRALTVLRIGDSPDDRIQTDADAVRHRFMIYHEIVRAMEDRGLTVTEAAGIAGVDREWLMEILNGYVTRRPVDQIRRALATLRPDCDRVQPAAAASH